MNQVIIDFAGVTDEAIATDAAAVVAGCNASNTNFNVVTQLAVVVTALGGFNTALAACAHGNEADTDLKNTKKGLLVIALRVLGVQVNVQANRDRIKALSSGFPMEKEGSHQVMGDVANFKVAAGSVAGYMNFSADKPKTYSTHGTIFAFWDVALGPTPADKNKWFQRHSNGVSLTIAGFTPGVTYPFAAAYKGLDTDLLLWTPTMNKMAGD